jgi:hypothetical protein
MFFKGTFSQKVAKDTEVLIKYGYDKDWDKGALSQTVDRD